MSRKEARELVREAERQGWRVEPIGDGYQLYAPDGETIVTIHVTESDVRALRNTIARMRRVGFRWKGR